MKILISILVVLLCLSIIFFVYNYNRLEIVELDNGIGSYSVVQQPLYDSSDLENPNTFHIPILYPDLIMSDFQADFIINAYSSKDSTINLRSWYNSLLEFGGVLNDSYNEYNINILNDEFKGGVRLVADNVNLPFKPLSNVRYTPREFYEEYPNGYSFTLDNVKMYRFLYFYTSDNAIYTNIDNLECRMYCAPNPLNPEQFILTINPFRIQYEYNAVRTFSQLEKDIEIIQNAKPIFPMNDDNLDEAGFFKKLYALICYPINYIGYVGESSMILINDLAGFVVINDFSAVF